MISYLQGNVMLKEDDYIILNVQGIGYKVFVAEKMLSKISEGAEHIEVFCYLRLRQEETIELYGFPSLQTLKLFEILNNISGIGPKAALALSSLGTREELQKAIEQRDATFFAGVKGIGTKKIQKVMVELTGKFDKIPQEDDSKDKEVLDALVSLGFPLQRARDALSQIPQEAKTTEEKIRAALKIVRG